MNENRVVDITALQLGDEVEVRVSRRYGEEADCADSWTGYVQSVDPERDMIYVTHNSPETMTDPEPTCQGIQRGGSNEDGVNPSNTPTGVVLIKRNLDGQVVRYKVINADPIAKDMQAAAIRKYRIGRAKELAYRVQKVSYGNRDELAAKLLKAIDEIG